MKQLLQRCRSLGERILLAYSLREVMLFVHENGLKSAINTLLRKIKEKNDNYHLTYDDVMLKHPETSSQVRNYCISEINSSDTESNSKIVRILYLIHQFYPYHYAGTEKFVLNLASSIRKNGNDVQILTYSLRRIKNGVNQENMLVRDYFYNHMSVVEIKHRVFPVDIHTACDNGDVYRFAERWFQEASCDVMHVGHPMRLTAFMRAAFERGIPYVVTLTDYWMLCPKGTLQTSTGHLCAGPEGGEACRNWCPELSQRFVRRRLEQAHLLLRGAYAVVSPSAFLAAVFQRAYPDLDIKVIPHGIDFRSIKVNDKVTYAKHDRIVVAYCGNIHPHKGVHVLVKAFKAVDHANITLRIYGEGRRKRYVRYLTKLIDQDPRVAFCGRYASDEIGEIFSTIDVLVVPSLWYENYPLVLHEALASRVPVLASNIGGMQEKIRDMINGLLFRVGDHRDLADKIALLAEHPSLLGTMKERMTTVQVPSLEEEACLYEQLYRNARRA